MTPEQIEKLAEEYAGESNLKGELPLTPNYVVKAHFIAGYTASQKEKQEFAKGLLRWLADNTEMPLSSKGEWIVYADKTEKTNDYDRLLQLYQSSLTKQSGEGER